MNQEMISYLNTLYNKQEMNITCRAERNDALIIIGFITLVALVWLSAFMYWNVFYTPPLAKKILHKAVPVDWSEVGFIVGFWFLFINLISISLLRLPLFIINQEGITCRRRWRTSFIPWGQVQCVTLFHPQKKNATDFNSPCYYILLKDSRYVVHKPRGLSALWAVNLIGRFVKDNSIPVRVLMHAADFNKLSTNT